MSDPRKRVRVPRSGAYSLSLHVAFSPAKFSLSDRFFSVLFPGVSDSQHFAFIRIATGLRSQCTSPRRPALTSLATPPSATLPGSKTAAALPKGLSGSTACPCDRNCTLGLWLGRHRRKLSEPALCVPAQGLLVASHGAEEGGSEDERKVQQRQGQEEGACHNPPLKLPSIS